MKHITLLTSPWIEWTLKIAYFLACTGDGYEDLVAADLRTDPDLRAAGDDADLIDKEDDGDDEDSARWVNVCKLEGTSPLCALLLT